MLQTFRQSRQVREGRRFELERLEDRVQPNDMFNLGGSALLGLDAGFLFRDPLASALRSSVAPQIRTGDAAAVTPAGAQLQSVAAAVRFVNVNDLQPVSDLNAPPADKGFQLSQLVLSQPPGGGGGAGPGAEGPTWYTLANIPVTDGLSQTTIVADDSGFVYSIGGGVGPGPAARINNLLRYDPATDSWATMASIPNAQGLAAYGAAVHYFGYIYVFGGIQGAGMAATPVNSLWIYEIASDTWFAGPNLPAARFGSAVAVINDKIYIAGGADAQIQRNIWEFDPVFTTYTEKAPIPANVPNPFRIHGAGVGTELHAFAGGFGGFNHIVYDTATDSWSARPRMPFGATDPGVAAVGDKIYVAGGDGNLIGAGLVQVYDTTFASWGLAPFTPGPTSNTSAAYNPAYGTLHVMGGFFNGQSIPVNWYAYPI